MILGAAATTLVGCTEDSPKKTAAVNPDIALLAAAVGREQALLATYQGARVAPALVADVTAHLTRLAAVPVPQPTPTATAAAVPAAPKALARATAAAHAAAVPLASRTLAPVLASLAASSASHATVL